MSIKEELIKEFKEHNIQYKTYRNKVIINGFTFSCVEKIAEVSTPNDSYNLRLNIDYINIKESEYGVYLLVMNTNNLNSFGKNIKREI